MNKKESTEQKGIAGEKKSGRLETSVAVSIEDHGYLKGLAGDRSIKEVLHGIITDHRVNRRQASVKPAASAAGGA